MEWDAGTTKEIEWSSTGDIGDVKLELYNGDAFIMEIIANTTNDGEFIWVAPLTIGGSDLYNIKITDLSHPSVFIHSDYFNIIPKEETLPPVSPVPLILSSISLAIAVSVGIAFTLSTLKNRKQKRRNRTRLEKSTKGKSKT